MREKTHSPYYAFNFCKHELAEMEKLRSDFYQKLIKICQQGNSTREGEVAASSHNKKFIIFLLVFVSSGEYEALTLCLRIWRSAKNGGTRDARRAIIEMNMHSYTREIWTATCACSIRRASFPYSLDRFFHFLVHFVHESCGDFVGFRLTHPNGFQIRVLLLNEMRSNDMCGD